MAAKTNKLSFKTLLTILIIVLIIAAVAAIVLLYDSKEIFNVYQILDNKEKYLNEDEIIVEGYFYNSTDGPSLIKGTLDSQPIPTRWLRLNLEDVDNISRVLVENTKYHLTGKLHEIQQNTDIPGILTVELKVIKVDEV